MTDWVIEVANLRNYLGQTWVHDNVNFNVARGEIIAIIGGSGAGKTTILRSLLLLQTPTEGSIKLFNQEVWQLDNEQLQVLRRRTGMLFQKSALFSGMSILENVMFPLQHLTQLNDDFIREIAFLKLLLVGIEAKDVNKLPSELSGGMQKRVAAARAIALEPDLLFLDEPVSGLDPKSAQAFDELLLFLRDQLGLTIVMVSHDVQSLERVTDRVIFLGEGRVINAGHLQEVRADPHRLIKDYFAAASS
jgi:phospholipid/cholesterol/gamma-HCH transport system ATP-binding protein